MQKKDETLREVLLDCARKIADTEGISAVNIRQIAARAGVASGTVYHYFDNKDDILLALTERYWREILLDMEKEITDNVFSGQLKQIYTYLSGQVQNFAGKLMNSLGNVKSVGRRRMQSTHQELRTVLMEYMERDKSIRGDIWNEVFTREKYVNFIIMNVMACLSMQEKNIEFLIEIVKRTLY